MGCGKKKPPAEAGGFSKAKQRSQLVGALGIHGIGTILDPILADGILRSVLVDVVGDHQGLVAVLNLQGVVEARSVDVGTHSLLGQTDSHGVLGGDDAGQLQASGNQVLALVNNLGHQAQVPSFISVDEVTGQHHLISTAGADQTRQEVGGGHVAAADAHVGIEAGETSGLGADTNVRAHSQREATASGDVVDQGDPGLRSLSNEPLQLAQLNLIVIEAGNGLLVVGQALLDIAKLYRDSFDVKVVGITGSVGKTSTKEMIASVLAQKYNVHKTQGNFNNECGLPLTIFEMNEEHQVSVLEMGINHFGEMRKLSTVASPDICVITNIGVAHLEFLKTREGIMQEKTQMFQDMKPGGSVVLNGDDPLLSTIGPVKGSDPIFYGLDQDKNVIYATDVEPLGLKGTFCTIHLPEGSFSCVVPIPGIHMVSNALAGSAVGSKL